MAYGTFALCSGEQAAEGQTAGVKLALPLLWAILSLVLCVATSIRGANPKPTFNRYTEHH
jgi:hypothetical protein